MFYSSKLIISYVIISLQNYFFILEKNLYPFSAALVGVWDTLAMVLGVEKKQLSVEFKDVHFYTQPLLRDQQNLRLHITLHRGTGRFEVS